MPGWWYNVESVTTLHLLSQFKKCIEGALASDQKTRALMRARSAKQRFPVAQWVEDLDILQMKAIKKNLQQQKGIESASSTPASSLATTPAGTPPGSGPSSRSQSRSHSPARPRTSGASSDVSEPSTEPAVAPLPLRRRLSSLFYPAHPTTEQFLPFRRRVSSLFPIHRRTPFDQAEQNVDAGAEIDEEKRDEIAPLSPTLRPGTAGTLNGGVAKNLFDPTFGFSGQHAETDAITRPTLAHYRRTSTLSVDEVVGQGTFELQNVSDSFSAESAKAYSQIFVDMLENLDAKNSEGKLCIENFLYQAERNWYARYFEAKLGKSVISLPSIGGKKFGGNNVSVTVREDSLSDSERSDSLGDMSDTSAEQFKISSQYKPPTGIARLMMFKSRHASWPLYAFLLSFGQIIAVNSHQITIITGAQGENANKLYTISSIYLAGSIFWWFLTRKLASRWALSLPFCLYGLAFFFVGIAPFGSTIDSRGWLQNVGAGIYSFASASGSLFFALNFGSESGVPVQTMIFRATAVQGIQQLWVSLLWWWSDLMSSNHAHEFTSTIMNSKTLLAIMTPIAFVFFAIWLALFFGLPDYYRASPGSAPSFYSSIISRKIVLWFLFAVIVQNYWLSAPTGRNWQYLFSSTHAPAWVIVLLLLFFFVVIWGAAMYTLSRFSDHHSWFLPIFGSGLGAPRWCQILWSTSGMGAHLPWGSAIGSAVAGRSLWLLLGTYDALQGVGIGTILLQTLTRTHVAITLIFAQVLGSIATIAARASAPDATGPGAVFPNLAVSLDGLGAWSFWVCLVFQMVIPVGFLLFFRNEQLFKP